MFSEQLEPHRLAAARSYYTLGYRLDQIGPMLGFSTRSAYRWKAADLARGIDWDYLRTESERINRGLLVIHLEQRLGEALADDSLSVGDRAEAVMRLSVALQAERRHLAKLREGAAK